MSRNVTTASTAKRPATRKRGDREPTFTEQARRTQILEVAGRLFRDKGFANTSLDEIAKEVGVSRGVLFYYFDGKREIGENTVRERLRRYSDYVRERVARKRTSKTQLVEFVDACLDYQNEHPEVYIEYIELLGCLGDSGEKYRLTQSVNQRTRSWLVEIIKAAQAEGEIARVPVQPLADVIQAIIDGMMEMTAMEPGVVDVDECKKLVRRMLANVIES
jgi:AcrR family transcriptional regulator